MRLFRRSSSVSTTPGIQEARPIVTGTRIGTTQLMRTQDLYDLSEQLSDAAEAYGVSLQDRNPNRQALAERRLLAERLRNVRADYRNAQSRYHSRYGQFASNIFNPPIAEPAEVITADVEPLPVAELVGTEDVEGLPIARRLE